MFPCMREDSRLHHFMCMLYSKTAKNTCRNKYSCPHLLQRSSTVPISAYVTQIIALILLELHMHFLIASFLLFLEFQHMGSCKQGSGSEAFTTECLAWDTEGYEKFITLPQY